jgi:hypothetical protein
MVGTVAGAVGSAILLGTAAAVAVLPTFSASLVYSVCLVAMLGCSAAYNLASNTSRREFLRKLDHAAIFLMIAGTYTPFTTCRLHGVRAIGMTAAVWAGAVTGAVMKLICPHRIEQISTVVYLARSAASSLARYSITDSGGMIVSETSAQSLYRRTSPGGHSAAATSSVSTVKLWSVFGPKLVLIATSAASRPRAISTRPIRGMLLRASKVYHSPPR